MYALKIKLIATLFAVNYIQESLQTNNINTYFESINSEFKQINAVAAKLTWDSLVNPEINLVEKSTNFLKDQVNWQHLSCARLSALQNHHLLNSTQERQTYLLCRGAKFSYGDARHEIYLRDIIQSQYSNAELCFESSESDKSITNIADIEKIILKHTSIKTSLNDLSSEVFVRKTDEFCLRGEEEFQNVMANSRNEDVLKFAWLEWRKIVSNIKIPYMKLINLENKAAQSNGYSDIGGTWRDELEIPDIRKFCRKLFDDITPLYVQLHGVVRYFLRMFHGGGTVLVKGPIPAYLLGDLWGQNWDTVSKIMIPSNMIDLDSGLRKLNWTTEHMITRVEDFYQSLGLPPLNELFWKKSVFKKTVNKEIRCHGTAANMFKKSDYRLLYCAGNSMYDFYVLHHEIGHIHYYMAYEQQPGIFQQGANSAFHESIGDTIMLGVLTPQHLNRLGIINDTVLYNQEFKAEKNININEREINYNKQDLNNVLNDLNPSELILFKQALKELPEIAFGLVLDEYRWELFEGNINGDEINKRYWSKVLEVQGIAAPCERGEEYFDVAAKYHVADHTPYIRYFLSSFLHHQLFEELCKAAVFGRRGVLTPLPDSIALHKCDIYGSKSAGRILKDIMSQGSSKKWDKTLFEATRKSIISSDSLLRYYQPLQPILARIIRKYDIPLGW